MPRFSKHHRLYIVLCLLLTLFIVGLFLLNNTIYPSMKALSDAKVKALATDAMHDAILASLSSGTNYATLLEATENGERVYMLNADPIAMNKLSSDCSRLAQENLSKLSEVDIKISLGTLSGISLLSGLGPDIKIKFTPAAAVKATFSSSLTNSGINQTLYRVKIELTTDMYVILPGSSHKVTVTADAAVAESVIVGDVPQVYTNVAGSEELLNLIDTDIPEGVLSN